MTIICKGCGITKEYKEDPGQVAEFICPECQSKDISWEDIANDFLSESMAEMFGGDL